MGVGTPGVELGVGSCTKATRVGKRLTACWSKTLSRPQFQIAARFPFRKPLPATAGQHACAYSPASALHDFLTENRSVLFPGHARHLRPKRTHPLAKTHTPQTESASHCRTSEAGSSPSGARSDAECNQWSCASQVNCDTRAEKCFRIHACVVMVTSPNGISRWH